jgi:hypothetical protein
MRKSVVGSQDEDHIRLSSFRDLVIGELLIIGMYGASLVYILSQTRVARDWVDYVLIGIFCGIPSVGLVVFGGPWRFHADVSTRSYWMAYGWLPIFARRIGRFDDIESVEPEHNPRYCCLRILFHDGKRSARFGAWDRVEQAEERAREVANLLGVGVRPTRKTERHNTRLW